MPLSTILKYGASIAVCLCVIFPQVSASAATLNNPSLETAYAAYIKKLEKKKSQSSMQAYLEKLNSTLALIEEKKKLSTKQKKIVEDLYRLNNEQLFTYDLANIGGTDIGQKIIETNEKNSLKSEIKTPVIPNYITAILATNRQLTVTTDGYEFVSNNAIKKFQFRTYFKIDPSNYTAFLSKTGQVINISGTQNFLFVEDYEIEEKIPYTKLGERMKFAFDDETKFQLEEGVWYSYNFEKYFFFEDRYGLYISSLEANGLQAENLLLYRTSAGKYTFIKEYEKVKLVSDIYIYGVSDKYNFLQNIINDKKYETGDTDLDFDALRKDTEALISGLKPSQRIPAIYNFVLDRLSYTESFTLENKKISSGILAYKNEDGICEGYAKLFAYMLNYAYISDVEVRRGFVIDAQDFPEVGHAWVRVGEAYYDPTFDDPIGGKETRTPENYKYYDLPKDLIYTNRYDYAMLPENLKTASKEFIDELIASNLNSLYSKYRDAGYVLLEPIVFRRSHGFQYNEVLTFEKLQSVIPHYEVATDGRFSDEDGIEHVITKVSFYNLSQNEIETILQQRHYDISDLRLLTWNTEEGSVEYRVAYVLEY